MSERFKLTIDLAAVSMAASLRAAAAGCLLTVLPGRVPRAEADITRLLLLHHFAGTPCGRTRMLWREHLGAEQPEVHLA